MTAQRNGMPVTPDNLIPLTEALRKNRPNNVLGITIKPRITGNLRLEIILKNQQLDSLYIQEVLMKTLVHALEEYPNLILLAKYTELFSPEYRLDLEPKLDELSVPYKEALRQKVSIKWKDLATRYNNEIGSL